MLVFIISWFSWLWLMIHIFLFITVCVTTSHWSHLIVSQVVITASFKASFLPCTMHVLIAYFYCCHDRLYCYFGFYDTFCICICSDIWNCIFHCDWSPKSFSCHCSAWYTFTKCKCLLCFNFFYCIYLVLYFVLISFKCTGPCMYRMMVTGFFIFYCVMEFNFSWSYSAAMMKFAAAGY